MMAPFRGYPQSDSVQKGVLSDTELLEMIQKKSLDYFLHERDDKTGLIADSANNFQKGASPAEASIAATGFGLAAYAVGVERGWINRGMALAMTRRILEFFLNSAEQEHGFFYHFLDKETGARLKNSELSPIDTALFLAGAIFAGEYYGDPGIKEMAKQIYERVDWSWMLNGADTLSLSWAPDQGFNKRHWDHYDESILMYLLAIGSPTHPIPASSWDAIARPVGSYGDYRLIQMPPLFTHQYPQIFLDLKDQNDGHADYFKNSINATLVNRAFCMDQAPIYPTYDPDTWGLTASDGPSGYRAYGAPPGWASHDGTVAPTGCGSSIVFTPKESIACLRHLYEKHGDQIWGNYGFSDAFNLDKDWFSQLVIGIDQGPLLLMIENYRSGLIWKTMKRVDFLQMAMKKVGFRPGTMDLPWPDPPSYEAPYLLGGAQVDGFMKDWPNGAEITLDRTDKELGALRDEKDLSAKVRFGWDERALYFVADVTDDSVIARKSGKNIWQDDIFEMFIDPQGDGLKWSSPHDFQIGFRPAPGSETVEVWSWFQGGQAESMQGSISARAFVHEKGYLIEGAIRWEFLGMEPKPGDTVRLSVAVNDVDKDRSIAKLQWFFRNEKAFQQFELGKLILQK